MVKSIPLQYAVYWLSKDGFLHCETWPFTLQFMVFWKSISLCRELGLSVMRFRVAFLRIKCSGVRLF